LNCSESLLFHRGDTGSNLVRDANILTRLQDANGSVGMTSSTQPDSALSVCSVKAQFLATRVIECASFDAATLLSTSAKTCRQNQIHLGRQIDQIYATAKINLRSNNVTILIITV